MPVSSPTITTNARVAHHQQSNETYNDARQIFENTATIDEVFKHKIIETIKDTNIVEIRKNIYNVHGSQDGWSGPAYSGHIW